MREQLKSTTDMAPLGERRLTVLQRLGLTDAEVDSRFDRLTRLAATLMSAPIALFNVVDDDRVWAKSSFGIEPPEVHLEDAFCTNTVQIDRTVVVDDLSADERYASNPYVCGEPGFRFYAGHPVHGPNGERIGTLCVLDFVPRAVSIEQLTALLDLASLLEADLQRIELAEALNENFRLETRFATVFAQSSEAMVLIDTKGHVLHANDGLNARLGYPKQTINADTYAEYVHPEDFPLMEKLFSAFAEGVADQADRVELRFRAPDGSWRWFEVWLHDLSDDPSVRAILLSARDVSDHLESASAQREANDRLNAALRTSRNGFLEFDVDGNLVAPHDKLPKFLGLGDTTLSDALEVRDYLLDSTGQPFSAGYTPVADAVFKGLHLSEEIVGIRRSRGTNLPARARSRDVVNGESPETDDAAVDRSEIRWLSLSTAPLVVGDQVHTIMAMRDVTAARNLERELAEQHRRYELIFEHATDVLAVVDMTGRISYASPATERVLGHVVGDSRPGGLLALIHPDDRNIIGDVFARVLRNRWDSEERVIVRVATAEGEWAFLEATATNLLLEPTINGILINARDVTSRELLTQALAHQAMRDPLTGIFNRRAFSEGLEQSLARTKRRSEHIALLWLDLNDFKAVNDKHGHAAGDAVLVEVARRLTSIVRAGDIVGRFGGDEFAIVLEPITGSQDALVMAERVLRVLSEPTTFNDIELTCLPSVGLALSGEGVDAEALMARADHAMYRAKRQGGAQVVLASGIDDPQSGDVAPSGEAQVDADQRDAG